MNRFQVSGLRLLTAVMAALLLLPLLHGCGNRSRIHQDLLHAEAIMEEQPDSAYAILSAMQPDSSDSEEDHALHALLLTQAIYKTYRLTYDEPALMGKADSMTRLAVKYFNDHDRNGRLMKALSYRGSAILMDKDSFTNALLPLYESMELAKEANDPLWIGISYDLISDVCFFSEAYHDQMEMLKKAVHYYQISGREEFMKYAQCGLAVSCIDAEEYDEGIRLAKSLQPQLDPDSDSLLYAGCFKVLGRGYFFTDQFSKCIEEIERSDSLGFHSPSMDNYLISAYVIVGNRPKALELYNKYLPELTEYDKVSLSYDLSLNPQEQLSVLQDLYTHTVKDINKINSLDLNSVHEEALRRSGMRHKSRLRSAVIRYGSLTTALILISCLLIWWGYRKRRDNKKLISINEKVLNEKEFVLIEKNELEAELLELQRLYEDAHTDTTILRKAGLKMSRLISVISKENDQKALDPLTALGKIKIEFDKYKPGNRNLKEWESILNQRYDNLLENLNNDIPDLTKEEKSIALYLLMGFTNVSIGYLCNLKERQEEFIISKLRTKIKALPEEKRRRYRLLMPARQEE